VVAEDAAAAAADVVAEDAAAAGDVDEISSVRKHK
jgi:hypothetical protein